MGLGFGLGLGLGFGLGLGLGFDLLERLDAGWLAGGLEALGRWMKVLERRERSIGGITSSRCGGG